MSEENNRAARTLVQFFDAVCRITTWNFQIKVFNDNLNSWQQIFLSRLEAYFVKNIPCKQNGRKNEKITYVCSNVSFQVESITSFCTLLSSTLFHLKILQSIVTFSFFPSAIWYHSIDLLSNNATCSEKAIRRCRARKFIGVARIYLVLKVVSKLGHVKDSSDLNILNQRQIFCHNIYVFFPLALP